MQLTGSVSGLRVGLMKEGFTGAKDDVAQTVKAAANSLKQLGVTVEEFSYPPHRDCKSSFLHSINTKNQWRRQGVCRPGQTSVLPPPITSAIDILMVTTMALARTVTNSTLSWGSVIT